MSQFAQFLLLAALQLLLPAYFIVSLWRSSETDRLGWLLRLLYIGAFLAYVAAVGRWDILSYYLRYGLLLLYVCAAIVSFRRVRERPFIADGVRSKWVRYVTSAVLLIVFSSFLAWAVRGWFFAGDAVDLRFPLADGWYYVGQGGNSTIINYHNVSKAQRYAMDIVALNVSGARARGLFPDELSRYVIFGKTIHSPCEGRVEAAVDQFPNQVPPSTDRKNVAGNHVVIACAGVSVLLAHMQPGSVAVRAGQTVQLGQVLGKVGNSGNTSEPHLHIHAVRERTGGPLRGEGVPILFDGRFAVRNTTLRRGAR